MKCFFNKMFKRNHNLETEPLCNGSVARHVHVMYIRFMTVDLHEILQHIFKIKKIDNADDDDDDDDDGDDDDDDDDDDYDDVPPDIGNCGM